MKPDFLDVYIKAMNVDSRVEREIESQPYPLLFATISYVYRILLTGIHLMRSGEIEANLVTLNQEFKLPCIADLIVCKLSGPEKSTLDDVDVEFHQREYERLRTELEQVFQASQLPEAPQGKAALNDLLIRLRLAASGLA